MKRVQKLNTRKKEKSLISKRCVIY